MDEEKNRVQVIVFFENLAGQGVLRQETPAFQREEVELVKPFLIWHVTVVSLWPLFKMSNSSQLVNIGYQIWIVTPFAYGHTKAQYGG